MHWSKFARRGRALYLDCAPTASRHLKLLLDAVALGYNGGMVGLPSLPLR
jgi:hypothetical protein